MIKLTRIVEQTGMEGQYYDLGRDFANFKRTIDGANEEVKKRYEQSIGTKLIGKRIRARASRGYKQYVKDYEFDVVKITLDDYYDNFVVVAHDNTTPKAKEYFLKPGFKVQVLGPATGQPSPQKGDKPGDQKPESPQQPVSPAQHPNKAQSQPMALAPVGQTPSEQPVKEEKINGYYDAYSIEEISKDIEKWLPNKLKKPDSAMRDFIKGLGWRKKIDRDTNVALYDIRIPNDSLSKSITQENIQQEFDLGMQMSPENKYQVVKMNFDEAKEEWNVRIKKTMMTPQKCIK